LKESPILKLLLNNFAYKVLALAIACMLWYFVQGKEVLEVNRRLQVNFIINKGYMIKGADVRFKEVTIKGPRALLDYYTSRPLEANIKVPGEIGEHRFRIEKRFLEGWNSRLSLIVHDPYIKITTDLKKSRTLPVKHVTQGLPADGYTIEKVSIKPATVTVSGPKDEIDKLTHIPTSAINISGLQNNKSIEAPLFIEQNKNLALSIDKVTVGLRVGETKINKRFTGIPLEIEGGEHLATPTPRFVTIVIQGTPAVLNFVERNELRAFLDARSLTPGDYERKVQVKIPPNTALIETHPENAKVEIHSQPKVK
jgi:YbbR domain-containing protein